MRKHSLQFHTNIEIGNMTLGSAACCHSKDALDGIEFGQFNSYLVQLKWVTRAGELAQASAADSRNLLRMARSSYGLAGVVYEVSFQVEPIEALHFTYTLRPVSELTVAEIDNILDDSEGLICWTVQQTCIFQRCQRIADPGILSSLVADARRMPWNYDAAHAGHLIDQFLKDKSLRDSVQNADFVVTKFLFSTLHLANGITLLAPHKIIDYRKPQTTRSTRSPSGLFRVSSGWIPFVRRAFADQHFQTAGFRCNTPLGSYHIRLDTSSILSYTYDGEIFSIDPIHASTDDTAWHYFLQEFNDFAFQRNGIPFLNQSPFVEAKHVQTAYGQRWTDFQNWIKTMDPNGRMLNPFFAALLQW